MINTSRLRAFISRFRRTGDEYWFDVDAWGIGAPRNEFERDAICGLNSKFLLNGVTCFPGHRESLRQGVLRHEDGNRRWLSIEALMTC